MSARQPPWKREAVATLVPGKDLPLAEEGRRQRRVRREGDDGEQFDRGILGVSASFLRFFRSCHSCPVQAVWAEMNAENSR